MIRKRVSTRDRGRLLGIAAFDTLRAEDEPFLDACFVPPPDFELMAGTRSAIIFGKSGSGKSATRKALENRIISLGKPKRIRVDWRPAPLAPGVPADSFSMRAQLAQVLDACAVATLRHIGCYPDDFLAAPDWAQDVVAWFVRCALLGDWTIRLRALATETDESARLALNSLAARPPREVLRPEATPELVIDELARALLPLGLEGFVVVADGLEVWLGSEQERLTEALKAFLSALELFERSRLTYKLFVPAELEPVLVTAGGTSRRRLDSYHLHWTEKELTKIVEQRLALAVGRKGFRLTNLCEARGLRDWLKRVGGMAPRGWLESMRPLLTAYLENKARTKRARPLTEEEWARIRRRFPPPLSVDRTTGRVTVGWQQIEDLSPVEHALLAYLYERRGEICSKRELYDAYLTLYPERKPTGEIIVRKDYEGLIDTALWRLRRAIEPVPDSPLLIETVKGRGIRLNIAW